MCRDRCGTVTAEICDKSVWPMADSWSGVGAYGKWLMALIRVRAIGYKL